MRLITEGVVLRKVAYSGSSAIVTIYTRRYGQTPFMVRGLGRKGGKSAALQPLSRVEIACSYREKYQVQSLSSIALKRGATVFMHPLKAAVALFLAEILFKALREEAPDEERYNFIDAALEYFENQENTTDFHLIFMMRLTRFLGFFPAAKSTESRPLFDLLNGVFTSDPNASLHMLNPKFTNAFTQLIYADFGTKIFLSNADRRHLLEAMVEYYQLQLEGLGQIKSLRVFTEIFKGYSDNLP